MKKNIELLAAVKGQGALLFGGVLFAYTVIRWWFGYDSVSSILLVQMAIISMLCAGLQYLCFAVDKKHKPTERIAGFLIIMFLILTAFAYFGSWFVFTVTSFLIFIGIFIVTSAILLCVYGAYFKITGTRYNQMLTAYKIRHAADDC